MTIFLQLLPYLLCKMPLFRIFSPIFCCAERIPVQGELLFLAVSRSFVLNLACAEVPLEPSDLRLEVKDVLDVQVAESLDYG